MSSSQSTQKTCVSSFVRLRHHSSDLIIRPCHFSYLPRDDREWKTREGGPHEPNMFGAFALSVADMVAASGLSASKQGVRALGGNRAGSHTCTDTPHIRSHGPSRKKVPPKRSERCTSVCKGATYLMRHGTRKARRRRVTWRANAKGTNQCSKFLDSHVHPTVGSVDDVRP